MTDTYECRTCGSRQEAVEGHQEVPECCHRPMEKMGPLPFCTMSETAEHSRMDQSDDACDDGRAGS